MRATQSIASDLDLPHLLQRLVEEFTVTRNLTVRAFSTDVAETWGRPVPSRSGHQHGTAQTATLTPTDDSYTAKGNASATHGSERSLNLNLNLNLGASERRST